MRASYIRFVVNKLDRNSGKRLGLFQAVFALIDANVLLEHDLLELNDLRQWFSKNLDAPDRFSHNRNSRAAPLAISWFKSTAAEHISRMRAMCRILNEYGVATEVIMSARPGYIVFEDDHQVAAIPYADTQT